MTEENKTKYGANPRIKQGDLVDKPFALLTDKVMMSWKRWSGSGFNIGKWTDDNKFQQWDNDLKQWTEIKFNREDNWRKLFTHILQFDKPYDIEVWDKETKARMVKSLSVVEVEFSGGVETQLEIIIESEQKRGGNPMKVFWMLKSKKTGTEIKDIEYTISYEKPMSTGTDKFKIDIPNSGEPKEDVRQKIIDAVKSQTGKLEPEKIQAYKAQIVDQIKRLLIENELPEDDAETIFTNHIVA